MVWPINSTAFSSDTGFLLLHTDTAFLRYSTGCLNYLSISWGMEFDLLVREMWAAKSQALLHGFETSKLKLDQGSIRSSPRYGLSTPYRLTIRNSARLFHHVLINIGNLHLVLPALNLSTLNVGILLMMQQVRRRMFSLNMVDYSMSFLSLYTWDFFLLDK